MSGWNFPWKGKGLLLQWLVLLPELPPGQLLSDPCSSVAQLGYQQTQGIQLLSWPTTSSTVVKLVGGLSEFLSNGHLTVAMPSGIFCLLFYSVRYLNKPRSSWNLFMRNPCWMSSSSTHVCMNIASLSTPSCVSVSSFSRWGLTCSAAGRLWPRTSDEGRLVTCPPREGRNFLVDWCHTEGR